MDFSPELGTVVAAMRARFDPDIPSSAKAPSALAGDGVMHIAVRNKLVLLLGDQLQPALSDAHLRYTDYYRHQTMQMNSAILRESVSLFQLLKDNNEECIFIKGPIQQKIIYGDFFSRPTSDIDILVDPSSYRRVSNILSQQGYNSHSSSLWWRLFLGEQHLTKVGPPPLIVDLHYRMQQPGSPAPRSTRDYLSKPDWTSVMGVELPHLANHNVPVMSAISIVKGLFNRDSVGAHVADLYACIRADVPHQLNNFLTVASQQHLLGTAMLALRIISETFGVRLQPAAAIQAMLPGVSGTDLVRMALTPDDPTLLWPKRREVLWHLCLKHPGRYAKEATRALASETALRLFERPAEPVNRQPG